MFKGKIISFAAAAALCLTAGCASSRSVSPAELAKDLLNNGVYAEELSPVSAAITEKRYALGDGLVTETAAYVGTNAVVDEIAVFKTDDTEAVCEKAREHIANQKKTYESYRPSEVSKLDGCVIETVGDCVAVCVCEDSEKAREIIGAYMK